MKPHQILQDPDFLALSRRKNSISLVFTLITVVFYFGFIFLLAFGREHLAEAFSGQINRGIPFGIGIIILSWILTGLYVRWANSSYDDMVARMNQQLNAENKETL